MSQVAGLIADILDSGLEASMVTRVRGQVAELCARFPVYGA